MLVVLTIIWCLQEPQRVFLQLLIFLQFLIFLKKIDLVNIV